MVKIKVQMTRKALARYMYGHAYNSFSGILSVIICLGILALGIRNVIIGGEGTTSILYIAIGILLLSHTHITIYFSSKKQMKEAFSDPITYTIEKERLLVEVNDIQAEYAWKDLMKVTKQGNNIIVQCGYRNAFIWPLESIGDQYDQVVAALKEVMDADKVKIK